MEAKSLLDLCAEKWAQHFKTLGFKTYIFGTNYTDYRFVSVSYDGSSRNIHISCRIIDNEIYYRLFSYVRKPSYCSYPCANEHEMLAKVLSWLYEGE